MSTENEQPTAFKPKKSVALSGVVAGNTALCSVGKSGNDLHYRGYDIADLAEAAEFEEVVGRENICDNVQAALRRAEEVYEGLEQKLVTAKAD